MARSSNCVYTSLLPQIDAESFRDWNNVHQNSSLAGPSPHSPRLERPAVGPSSYLDCRGFDALNWRRARVVTSATIVKRSLPYSQSSTSPTKTGRKLLSAVSYLGSRSSRCRAFSNRSSSYKKSSLSVPNPHSPRYKDRQRIPPCLDYTSFFVELARSASIWASCHCEKLTAAYTTTCLTEQTGRTSLIAFTP